MPAPIDTDTRRRLGRTGRIALATGPALSLLALHTLAPGAASTVSMFGPAPFIPAAGFLVTAHALHRHLLHAGRSLHSTMRIVRAFQTLGYGTALAWPAAHLIGRHPTVGTFLFVVAAPFAVLLPEAQRDGLPDAPAVDGSVLAGHARAAHERYRAVCAAAGVDPEAELTEARLSAGTPPVVWMAYRLARVHARRLPPDPSTPVTVGDVLKLVDEGNDDRLLNAGRSDGSFALALLDGPVRGTLDEAMLADRLVAAGDPPILDEIARRLHREHTEASIIGHPATATSTLLWLRHHGYVVNTTRVIATLDSRGLKPDGTRRPAPLRARLARAWAWQA